MNLFNNQSKFLDRFFRKVDGLVWDISTGKLGVQGPDGIYTCEITEAEGRTPSTAQISINPFDNFGLAIPAFATNTPHEQIAIGDLIVGAKEVLGWVIEKKPASLVLLDTKGMQKNYNPPKVAMIGQNGSMVVKSLTGLLGNGAQGFQSSLLPLLVMGEGTNLDLEKMIPLMLFSQQGAGTEGAANPMAQMMPMMMMLSAMKGGSSSSSSSSSGLTGGNTGVPPLTRTR
ncbi:MAG: hypothetical protein JWM85_3612 [Acidimicrobiaceae bacterium]|nr:hypothetical protein [Acidimicrobiaceae bacterium]